VATSDGLIEELADTDVIRDSSGKCNLIVQRASTGIPLKLSNIHQTITLLQVI